MIDRETCINLLRTAQAVNRADFARSLAADWLAEWPGDHEVQLILAQLEIGEGYFQQARDRLEDLLEIDPEYQAAYQALAGVYQELGDPHRAYVSRSLGTTLDGMQDQLDNPPQWIRYLGQTMAALEADDVQQAVDHANDLLGADPEFALATLIAVRAHVKAGASERALQLARSGVQRWPGCVYFHLLIADQHMRQGETTQSVEQLHKAAALDPSGSLTKRFLGEDHPYKNLWPGKMTSSLNRPIPADIGSLLGHNRLPAGSSVGPKTTSFREQAQPADEGPVPTPESWESFRGPNSGDQMQAKSPEQAEILREARDAFGRIASKLNTRIPEADQDHRVPAYIIVSSRTRLMQIYGQSHFRRIDAAMLSLTKAVRERTGWWAYRIFIDDPTSLNPFNLSPADPGNPWEIKLRLTDLDHELATRGEMIGAVLLVGGAETIPFHQLPNPADDDDEFIFSDNPYATTDENYFAPEWPVGRIPVDDDVDMLMRLLQNAAQEHVRLATSQSSWNRMIRWISSILRRFIQKHPYAIGYSANVWRKASMAVYKTIGNPRSLVTSPPVESGELPANLERMSHLSYFNLHGIEDAPEWFGQRDPFEDSDQTEEFPIALRPADIQNSGHAPQIVFSEACFGANVINKDVESAMSLKFLDSGSRIVIGSTKISYGSVTAPLIAADLLGRLFWENLNQGFAAGEALRRAKLGLAAEMHHRQGYLDGEDQKTLISFVYFGDPLFSPSMFDPRKAEKSMLRKSHRPTIVRTSSTLAGEEIDINSLDPSTMQKIKTIVADYLPGMADAQCEIHTHQISNGNDPRPAVEGVQVKAHTGPQKDAMVVSFTKHVAVGSRHHPRYARLTLDKQGKILKLAVSR